MFTKLKNIPVICYGLRSDFKTMAFPGSLRLFEVSDVMEELITINENVSLVTLTNKDLKRLAENLKKQ